MSDRTSPGGTAPAAGRRCPGRRVRAPGSRRASRGFVSDLTRTRVTWPPRRRPVVGAVAVSPAHRVAGDEPGAPGRDASARSGHDGRPRAYTRKPTGRSSSWSSASVGAGPRGGSRTPHRWCGRRTAGAIRPGSPVCPHRWCRPRPRARRGACLRADRLTGSRIAPATMTGDPPSRSRGAPRAA